MSEGVDLIDIYADEEFTQDPEFSNADQMDLYDDVLAASSQPQEKRSSSSEAPPEIRQEPSPKPNSKPPAILYTYSGLRNKRAAVYVGSFSWVSSSSWEIRDSWGTSEGLLGSSGEWQGF
ncbi:cleavage and polyadenylation specificity factor subunit 7 [Motacilla alba alba]|uniref:cleavage and polyadenylation specificity factor subunit 7 n=1 Tax=Motacilla alba alba TaxID=1094192 RepID=UPI0018D57783|nr:cleavage and polyadenylation specificity factor subunit 7 [Motacilla alba alba]